MGARDMAFMPVRYALITEGASDIILLPELLREATRKDSLGFQIVPGISESNNIDIAILENGAPRTAYLLDADGGGIKLRNQLKTAGIDEARIFNLPDRASLGLVLEDFINKEVYVDAVNEELRRSHGSKYVFPLIELSAANRPAKVKEWCKNQGINPPAKRPVAYRIIEQKVDKALLDQTYKNDLIKLFENIQKSLNVPKS
jgi:predicted ATP-dependent endonuclease of OLD family